MVKKGLKIYSKHVKYDCVMYFPILPPKFYLQLSTLNRNVWSHIYHKTPTVVHP